MNYFLTSSKRISIVKMFIAIAAVLLAVIFMSGTFEASAAAAVATPKIAAEKTYDSTYTHPYNKQTNTLIVHWGSVSKASKYQLFIKGGKYKTWTRYKTVTETQCTVSGLARNTTYYFKVRALDGKGNYSDYSSTQTLKTARMDYDKAGWEAMCRIVYHEVGQINDPMWDKPIVYVADCVTNRYVMAKYIDTKTVWKTYYKNYSNIQSVIYNSGGFMSSAQLTRDGATYAKVTDKVKKAVWGAVYGKTYYNNIANNYSIYYWCNRSSSTKSSKIAYSFKIPWGYFYIWKSYWG